MKQLLRFFLEPGSSRRHAPDGPALAADAFIAFAPAGRIAEKPAVVPPAPPSPAAPVVVS